MNRAEGKCVDVLVSDGRIGIACDGFKPGAVLWLDGQFDDDIQRLSFAVEMTMRLHANNPGMVVQDTGLL